MNQTLMLVPALFFGGLLGATFFLGLRWTVSRAALKGAGWLLFPLSFLVRVAILVAGFYLLSSGDWRRLLACLLGFTIARALVIRLTGKDRQSNAELGKGAGYAP